MKKTYSISDQIVQKIKDMAKEQGTTQSKILETSFIIYSLINYGDPKNARTLNNLVQDAAAKGQLDMIDQLFKK